MALLTLTSTGTPYIVVLNDAGEWWNGAAFEAYDAGSWGDYDIAATQFGSTKAWKVTFPALATGNYDVVQFLQAGGSPAATDTPEAVGSFAWDGTTLRALSDADAIDNSATAATALAAMFAAAEIVTVDDATLAPSTTAFETTNTTNENQYTVPSNQVLFGLTGANAGRSVVITGYAFTNSKVKLTVTALPEAPADGDTFVKMGTIP